ncbi:MAG: beta-galactosidase [Candidatus Andersenbacteria bacterium]|nr:beta-galactosidase [Candidatus Andersenbacteria bacterium]
MPSPFSHPWQYGATFSQVQAASLGLPWREVYEALLADLEVKRLRLVAYWPLVEPADGEFDWADLDYQMDQAAAHGAQVILTIGRKVPRWPECHEPEWLKGYSETEKQNRVMVLVAVTVARYRDHPALKMWQLENEPLLEFGQCPPADRAFLAREEGIVRAIDGQHRILITDSGELNSWLPAAAYGDVLGTTMYRSVWSGRRNRPFRYDYLFPAWLYRAKARLVKVWHGKDVLISELQGEPWGARPFTEMTREERAANFSQARFVAIRRFALRTQLPEAYWWGSEYWYWEKTLQKNPDFWELARGMF